MISLAEKEFNNQTEILKKKRKKERFEEALVELGPEKLVGLEPDLVLS